MVYMVTTPQGYQYKTWARNRDQAVTNILPLCGGVRRDYSVALYDPARVCREKDAKAVMTSGQA